jgi:hypothetical protein
MAQPSVVVAFNSICAATETVAHTAAVGTVNARTLPRLRRLTQDATPESAECQDHLRRMQKVYVPPSEADLANTPALIVVPSPGMTPSSETWKPFVAMLDALASKGTFAGKPAAVIDAGDRNTVAAFSQLLAARGFAVIDAGGADARGHGRAVGAALLKASAVTAG